MRNFAEEFHAAGHEVTIATLWPGPEQLDSAPIPIIRSPNLWQLWKEARKSELCLMAGLSLKGLFPLLLAGRPVVVTHQGWYYENPRLRDRIKDIASRWTCNICASHSIADHIGRFSAVVGNPYDSNTFIIDSAVEKKWDIAFVGRLVSDKGADVLLNALEHIRRVTNMRPKVAIIGDGVERDKLEKQAADLKLSDQVDFLGYHVGFGLAKMLNASTVLAVPSRWEEPFGIVALEGAACGCIVVATDGGGLPEAVGPSGYLANRNDAEDFACKLMIALSSDGAPPREAIEEHLERHKAPFVADQYLKIFSEIVHSA